jgi:hypothetical protein
MDAMNQQFVSLTGEVLGPNALQTIPGPPSDRPEELCINAASITKVDSFAAVAIQASFNQHISGHNESTACLWAPSDAECQRRLYSLLGNLPERCSLPNDFKAPKRDPRIIIPAMTVSDLEEAHLIGRTIRAAGSTARLGNLRLSVNHAQVLATSAVAFLDNALSHPSGSPCSPVVSCSIEAKSRNVQLVVHDLGKGVADHKAPLKRFQDCLQRSQKTFGGISTTAEILGRREDNASLIVRTGTAQGDWNGSWSLGNGAHSPGWAIALTLQRDQSDAK